MYSYQAHSRKLQLYGRNWNHREERGDGGRFNIALLRYYSQKGGGGMFCDKEGLRWLDEAFIQILQMETLNVTNLQAVDSILFPCLLKRDIQISKRGHFHRRITADGLRSK